jgi:Adenylate and Guanylate cyclase catalytic domain
MNRWMVEEDMLFIFLTVRFVCFGSRGRKARFQLFGDAVNTASRMESKGIPGKIHVSEATAEALRAAGKDDWLAKRDGQIDVKGKGLMQTYFAEPTNEVTNRRDNSLGGGGGARHLAALPEERADKTGQCDEMSVEVLR